MHITIKQLLNKYISLKEPYLNIRIKNARRLSKFKLLVNQRKQNN